GTVLSEGDRAVAQANADQARAQAAAEYNPYYYYPDDEDYWAVDPVLGCLFGAPPVLLPMVLLGALPVFGMGVGAAAPSKPMVVWSKRVRRKGRPVLGFFGGLLLGLGAVVLLWQYAVWTLQIWNVVGIPVVLAILALLVAQAGRTYRIELRLRPRPVTP